jgi:hypothetical protein
MRVRVLIGVFITLLLIPVARTYAQSVNAEPAFLPDDPGERDKEARADFELGKQSYENGEYRDAWGHFHDAYKLSARPELLYNIGQTADRLRMDADALKAFRLYLEKLPNAANRREVENRVHALEERVKQGNEAPPPPAAGTVGANGVMEIDAPKKTEEPPAPPSNGQPGRSGWYFRAALGFGLRRDGVSGGGTDGTLSGIGGSLDLAAGITLLPGLAVGGGLFFDQTSKPTLSTSGSGDQTLGGGSLAMIGPMADWYVNHETDGWHLQGALTLALLSYSTGNGTTGSAVSVSSGTGLGVLVGGGYEWPLSDAWGLGVMGRFVFAGVSADSFTHGFVSPSVLGTLTWY